MSAAVSVQSSRTSNGTSTVYTVPANSFLVCTIYMASQPDGGGTVSPHRLTIGGENIANLAVTGSHIFSGSLTSQVGVTMEAPLPNTFTVGPGETIQHTANFAGTGSATCKVVGTLFVNT